MSPNDFEFGDYIFAGMRGVRSLHCVVAAASEPLAAAALAAAALAVLAAQSLLDHR